MAIYHIVKQGECLSSIAHAYGLGNYRLIYDHPENAALKKLRGSPNILHPGDRLFVPQRVQREESRATDQRHQFVLSRHRVYLELVIKLDDEPVTNANYTLQVRGQLHRGKTDGEGKLREEIEPGEQTARLHVEQPELDWSLKLGQLDPATEVSGVQTRLNNLGHPCGAVDGIIGPRTRAALRQFKSRHSLKPTGVMDQAVVSALRKAHDGN